jgi:hypothetical protein
MFIFLFVFSCSETPYIGAAIYNVALLFMFIVPIVASGIGGRETTYAIRSFGIMWIILSSSLILFAPKVNIQCRYNIIFVILKLYFFQSLCVNFCFVI